MPMHQHVALQLPALSAQALSTCAPPQSEGVTSEEDGLPGGFKIFFHFAENPYFSNTVSCDGGGWWGGLRRACLSSAGGLLQLWPVE